MFNEILFYMILGLPLIAYIGMFTLACFLFTATIGFLNYHGKTVIPFKFHPIMAAISLTVGTIHAILSILAFI